MTQVEAAAVVGTGTTAPPVAAALAAIPGVRVTIVGRDPERARLAARKTESLGAARCASHDLGSDAELDAQLVVECTTESYDTKLPVLSRLEYLLAADAVIVTNTSSLSLATLAGGLSRPERFAGLHFLHPAHLTAVVEVVPGPTTNERTMDVLDEVVRAMGKRPLTLSRAVPGYIWNRLQFALLRECLHLLDERVADIESIDAAVSDGLAPRWLAGGPLACADLGGLETFRLVSEQLMPRLASSPQVSPALSKRAEDGASFYDWDEGSRRLIDELRNRVLEIGQELARERRAAMTTE